MYRILDDNFASKDCSLDLLLGRDNLELLLGPILGRVLGIALECVLVGFKVLIAPERLLTADWILKDRLILLSELLGESRGAEVGVLA